MFRAYYIAFVAVFCAVALFAQSTNTEMPALPATGAAPVPPAAARNAGVLAPGVPANINGSAKLSPGVALNSALSQDLRIGSGDLLQVTVFGAPDFNTELRVAEDGSVTLPLLGEVTAAGMTAAQFAKALKSRLMEGSYFNDPQVSVTIKEYAAEGVSVLGEVNKPGIYPIRGPSKLFEVISAAGGTTTLTGDKVTIVHRERPQEPETVKLSFGEQGSRQSNIMVVPGDTVIFEKAGLVYVVGDVRKPTGIVMSNPDLTVLQALAMAEGANPRAALSKAKLIRKTAQGPAEVPLPLDKMLSAKMPDVQVQPNDVIFVPGSAAKSAAKRGLESALQVATGLAIYRP
jgi:polysaccharide biosynthesis/export protein